MKIPQLRNSTEFDARLLPNDHGAALIVTLGVISMLIILGLSFGISSVYSKKGVLLNRNKIKAKLFSNNIISKGYQFLSQEFADPNIEKNLFPSTNATSEISSPLRGPTFSSDPDWDGRYYWISDFENPNGHAVDRWGIDSALHVTFAQIDYTPSTSFANSLATDDTFGWIHIYDPSDEYVDVTDTPIVARLAYLIIDESGKVDPTAICGTDTESEESRIGSEVQEINLKNIISSSLAEKFQSTAVNNGGLLPDGNRWDSYYSIFKRFKEDNLTIWTDDNNREEVLESIFPFSYDIEAYFDGSNDKHRFDLARADWNDDTMTVEVLLSPANNFSSSQSSSGIPWLYYSDKSDALKQQIAANIIDYSDTNKEATTDYPTNDPPTYVGNEQVPYINEILFYSWTTSTNNRIYIRIYTELINIFDVSTGSGSVINVQATITSPNINSSTPATYTASTGSIGNISGQSYYGLSTIIYIPTSQPDWNGDIRNITLSDVKIRLTNTSGKIRDYVYLDTLPAYTLNRFSNNYLWIRFEADDPRQNLNVSDWQLINSWSTTLAHTWYSLNSICNPNPGGDKDLEAGVVNPWDVSTAYIRNNTMNTLWELGAIHRGSTWETINLSTYENVVIQQAASTGFGDYNEGDANILSQVKLNSTTTTTGRININTYNENVLKGLLYDIKIGCSYKNPTTGSGLITLGEGSGDTDPIIMINEILTNNGVFSGDPFRFRGQIATIASLSNGTTVTNQTKDSAKEEIIGKIANLLTVRQNYFSVIAVSQVVQDKISNYGGGVRGRFDSDVDKILAEKKILAIYYRDALKNEFDLVLFEYLDE